MEPLAAACRILEQGLVKPGDRVAVVGDGKLGLLCAEVLGRQQPAVRWAARSSAGARVR